MNSKPLEVGDNLKNASKKTAFSPLMQTLTRIGYGARGLMYVTMGLLAVNVAIGKGGSLTSPQGAIGAIGKQPAGVLLLWIILIGLISYSLWGVIRAVFDPLHKGNDMKGLVARAGFLFSALGYAIMIVPTYEFIIGKSQIATGSHSEKGIAWVMSMPWGRVAIGIIGLAILASGLFQIYLGWSAKFDHQLQSSSLKASQRKTVENIGRFGIAARGVVLAIVGFLVVLAAYRANPSQPIGMDTALETLLKQPYGIWLLAIVAIGLIAFGVYSILTAIWFRVTRQPKEA